MLTAIGHIHSETVCKTREGMQVVYAENAIGYTRGALAISLLTNRNSVGMYGANLSESKHKHTRIHIFIR